MKQLKLTSSLLLATLLFACTGQRSASTTFDKNASTERAISDLLSKMTLDEKIGQMTLFTTDWGSTGPTIRPGYEGDIRQGRCGALFNSHTAAFTRKLQKIAVEESRLKIPLLFGYDVIHGYKTIFPMPLGEAASWDLQAIEKAAEVAAAEASAAGLHWTFAPMCDVSRDPRWGRVMEGAGEDTYLGSEIARARVRGFQGKSFENADRVLACVKHYAGYGAPIAGRDYNVVDMTERTLREVYLPPYKAAVEEGAWTVMTSFNEIDGTPATANSWLLEDVLRGEWKFKGMVVSDYTSVNEMVNHGNVANEKEAGEAALNAGLDMDMQGAVFQNHLAKSVQEGKVKMVQIDEAVRRILRLKHQLGLFENPYKYCDEERERRVVLSQANQDAARDVARKSVVLLKNDNVLPLSKNLGSVAVIGPLADDKDQMIGAWSGAGEGQHCVTLLQGVRDKLGSSGKATVHYAKGCELTGDSRNGFADAIAAAKRSDVVIIAIGEHKDWSGEAACRADITVPAIQEELVRQILTAGKPVVVVLMNGRPLVIPWLSENSPALVEAWYLGTQAGNALADVLFGDYNPSGKLPITFPRHQG
ncbi:MAG: glycoside hydrolase family 3 N-terminal domain-containing protein, partial [Bacteroidota bacterium]